MKIKTLGRLPDAAEQARRAARAIHDAPKVEGSKKVTVPHPLRRALNAIRAEDERAEVLEEVKRYRSRW